MLGDIPNLIIVAVEFAHLETAFQDMKSFVGENTIVLSLLCGIMSESISGQEIGMQRLGWQAFQRVGVTYCASPLPNDQFSFGTSTRLMNTSSRRSPTVSCNPSATAR